MRRTLLIWKKFMLLSSLTLMIFSVFGMVAPPDAASEDGGKQVAGNADEQFLAGRWLRPDGGYVLELSSVRKDGSMKAVYYNPKRINVSRAEWKSKNGVVVIFVELRDVNYPGSTYILQYDPSFDRLTGIYYQAMIRQKFDVEFVRKK